MCVRAVICREGGTPSSAAGRRRLPARRPPSPTPRHNGFSFLWKRSLPCRRLLRGTKITLIFVREVTPSSTQRKAGAGRRGDWGDAGARRAAASARTRYGGLSSRLLDSGDPQGDSHDAPKFGGARRGGAPAPVWKSMRRGGDTRWSKCSQSLGQGPRS